MKSCKCETPLRCRNFSTIPEQKSASNQPEFCSEGKKNGIQQGDIKKLFAFVCFLQRNLFIK